MKKYSKIISITVVLCMLMVPTFWYMALPGIDFPEPPPGAVLSTEGKDIVIPNVRAYFTNLSREEVVSHYSSLLSDLPSYRFNYPPEEAQTIIRDLLRSTYLEEVGQPFRESIFVNGFEPSHAKDAIYVNEVEYKQKITIKFVPSSPYLRVVMSIATLGVAIVLAREWWIFIKDVRKN